MSDPQIVEQIWVSVAEGAERTGFHPDHVRRLARENWRLPEAERSIRLHKASNEYTIWLPDLLNHAARHTPFADQPSGQPVEEIWVYTDEAAEMTGYNRQHIQRLAKYWFSQPEAERLIKVKFRSQRYELWLPDLIHYLTNTGHGPHPKKAFKNKLDT